MRRSVLRGSPENQWLREAGPSVGHPCKVARMTRIFHPSPTRHARKHLTTLRLSRPCRDRLVLATVSVATGGEKLELDRAIAEARKIGKRELEFPSGWQGEYVDGEFFHRLTASAANAVIA